MNKLFVVSRYKEDYSWIEKYTQNYLIYNKGEPIYNNDKIINLENLGGNQRDIARFCSLRYDNLPDITIFIQSYPFDHCRKDIFDELINRDKFAPLEYYGNTPANAWEARDEDGGFEELNNSWYISAHNNTHHQMCRYESFDQFMNKYFENYYHVDFVRFAPGSQYIVPKENILQYPESFWDTLMNELNSKTPTEGHIIERALYYIFTGAYKLRKEYL